MKNKNKADKFSPFKKRRWWLILTTVFLFIILTLVILVLGFEYVYAQNFYPGIKIGYLKLTGQTKEQALVQLKNIEENIQNKGLIFEAESKKISVNPIVISTADPDLAKPILDFDWSKTINEAYQAGRRGNWQQNLLEQFQLLLLGRQIPVFYNLNQPELITILQTNFSELEKLPLDAQLQISEEQIEVNQEQSGYVFNYQKAADQLKEDINSLDFKPIILDLVFQEAKIKKEHTGSAINSLEKILIIDSIKLIAGFNWWKITKEQFIPWLEFQKQNSEIIVGLNQQKVFDFLKPIADLVNVEAQDAKFELSGNRVTKFQASRDGKTLNLAASYQKINQQVISGNSKDIELVVDVTEFRVATGDVNNLGIKELIGRGVSNFAGSPKNRRHNIAVGAATLNGILIEPDQEFSLLKALGAVDGEHGYKQELVIKGDRTIPEYGGGLCQIGTTTFRAALYSGLPITQRQPHSYRVVYYEPAGLDATIYNPYPDMKFINDTGFHILFTTYIDGDNLIFDFYGTSDGRKIVIEPDPPALYNVTSPGEPRFIETDELNPGEKKQIERSHKGADTYFKYTVTYPNGEVKEQDFHSHYVAWPEVWLVGKQPEASTSTEEIINEVINN